MSIDELIEGVKRILDAATDKFNVLCEESGIEPDDPILTDEEEEESDENGDGEEGAKSDDGNTMPTPSDAQSQAPIEGMGDAGMPNGGLPPPDVQQIPAEAQQVGIPQEGQMPVEGGIPVEGGAAEGAPAQPEDEEQKNQQ